MNKKELLAENNKLKEELKQAKKDLEAEEDLYTQINKLLLWKSSLRVRVNEACPFVHIIGKEGYVGDLFPDGFTVVHTQENGEVDYWRLNGEWLDIVSWDDERFKKWITSMGYSQIKGLWIHSSTVS